MCLARQWDARVYAACQLDLGSVRVGRRVPWLVALSDTRAHASQQAACQVLLTVLVNLGVWVVVCASVAGAVFCYCQLHPHTHTGTAIVHWCPLLSAKL